MCKPWLLLLTLGWISSGSSAELLDVNRAPKFLREPISTIALKGGSVTLFCNVDGKPPPRIEWSRNGKPVLLNSRRFLLRKGDLFITKVINQRGNKPDVGVYQCKATNKVGTTVSRKVKLSVAVLSKFKEHPKNTTVFEGTTARFACKTRKAIPDPTVTWQKDGVPLDSANERYIILPSGVLQISGVKESDAGRYRCVAQNIAKTRYSNYAILTIKKVGHQKTIAPNITVAPSNITRIKGATAIMECVATGKPLPVVTWRKLGDNRKFQGASLGKVNGLSNLKIERVTERDSGKYECVARAAGKTIRRSAWLFVKEPPHFISRPQTMVAKDEGLGVQLLCSARGSPQPKITWLKNGRILHYKHHGSRISLNRGDKVLSIHHTNISDSGVYQCFAENDVGNIQTSSRVRVRRSSPYPLPPPKNFKVIADSSTSLQLTWDAPDFPLEIFYYSVECFPTKLQVNINADKQSSMTLKLDKLKPNTEYSCHVRAYGIRKVGIWSPFVKATTLDGAPTGPPTEVAVRSETPDSMDVSWNPPLKSKQHGKITNYLIRYHKDGQSRVKLMTVFGQEHKTTINNLDKGKTYTVQIAAKTSAGPGPFSTKTSGTVLSIPNGVISAPLLNVPRVNSTAVRLLWQPPRHGANRVVHYQLYSANTSQKKQEHNISISNQNNEYLLENLEPSTEYIIKLQAWDGKQYGKPARITVRTSQDKAIIQTSAPPPPQNIHCKPDSPSTSLLITWEDLRKHSTFYNVKYEIEGNKDEREVKTKVTKFKYMWLTGLTPGKEYSIRIQSQLDTQTLPGKFSKAVRCIIPEQAPSSPPLNVNFFFVTKTTVELMWYPPKQRNGKLIKYNILYTTNKTLDDKFWMTKTSFAASDLFTSRKKETAQLSGLRKNVTYFVKILAINKVGQGPPSDPIKVQGAQEQLVGRPVENLTVHISHSLTANVYWSKVTGSKQKIMKYVLFYSDDPKKPHREWKFEILDMTKSTFQNEISLHIELADLKPKQTYYIKMRAEYSAAVGPWSKTVQLSMPDDLWPIPTRPKTITTNIKSDKNVSIPEQRSSEEFAIKLGIIIGCVITILFTVILAVFILWRNPCRYGHPQKTKQDFELKDTKLSQKCYVPSAQMGFPHNITSLTTNGKEELSCSSSGPGHCQCHIFRRPAGQNQKLSHYGNGESQLQADVQITLNGFVHPGSMPSHDSRRNGSISSQGNGDSNRTVPLDVQSISDDKVAVKAVVIERHVNSNSLSVDV